VGFVVLLCSSEQLRHVAAFTSSLFSLALEMLGGSAGELCWMALAACVASFWVLVNLCWEMLGSAEVAQQVR
jgi:membrane protein implicated in regulation of membrane protease activity